MPQVDRELCLKSIHIYITIQICKYILSTYIAFKEKMVLTNLFFMSCSLCCVIIALHDFYDRSTYYYNEYIIIFIFLDIYIYKHCCAIIIQHETDI